MLRINLEVTEATTRLKQIEEVVVLNTGQVMDSGDHVYDVYVEGQIVATVTHHRPNGALRLAQLALAAVNAVSDGGSET